MIAEILGFIGAGLAVLASVLFGLLEKSKRKTAEKEKEYSDKKRQEAEADKKAVEDIVKVKGEARKEAVQNEKKVDDAIDDRRAGLDNDRLHD